jgi:hypothetical protein
MAKGNLYEFNGFLIFFVVEYEFIWSVIREMDSSEKVAVSYF